MPDRERDPADVLASLNQAFIRAGWLVDMQIVSTIWGPRLQFPRGMGLDYVEELALTIDAGLQTRVIGK
ncbi:hypothetical protein ACG2OD_14700 [Streptomyces sp. PDY-4]|uniref:hypothetical protein n=1 Tax=Streptomyces sp. PDY-4 TaxID=3376070 RepID=UPI00379783F6